MTNTSRCYSLQAALVGRIKGIGDPGIAAATVLVIEIKGAMMENSIVLDGVAGVAGVHGDAEGTAINFDSARLVGIDFVVGTRRRGRT
jgi:hypothetical protein